MSALKLLIILLICNYSFSQESFNFLEYHRLSCDARTHARNGEYKKAVKAFKKAVNSVENPKPLELFFLGKSYAQLGQKTNMIKYLELAYKKGYWYSLESDSLSFLPYWDDQDFLSLVNSQKILRKKFLNSRDTVLLTKVEFIFTRDEEIRIHIDSLQRLIYPSSNKNYLYQKQIDSLWQEDDINLNRFINLIKEYGFPSHEQIGNGFAEVLLLHCTDIFEENKELLYSELLLGNIMPWEYAAIYDRSNGPYDCKYGGYFCKSHVPKDELLENRREIGLSIVDCIPVGQIYNGQ